MAESALQKLSQAERWLAEARTLDDLKEIHDIAIAADAYAKAHKLGISAINHAQEVRLLAARRMGELVPAEKGGRGKLAESRQVSNISHQRLSEFRKLAEIPIDDFKSKIEELKQKEENITYSKIFQSPHVSKSTGENEWYTPPEFIEAARKTMGSIDCDPASSISANEIVKADTFFTKENDGRIQKWHGNIWMNPPYIQPLVADFCRAIVDKYQSGEIHQACVLVNNATETEWFQILLKAAAGVCFVKGRIKFNIDGSVKGTPLQGQAILYFGSEYDMFNHEFSKFGIILWKQNDRPGEHKRSRSGNTDSQL